MRSASSDPAQTTRSEPKNATNQRRSSRCSSQPRASRSGSRNANAGCRTATSAAARWASALLAAGSTLVAPLSSHSSPIGASRVTKNDQRGIREKTAGPTLERTR